jgi:hypothetical protein
MISVVCSAQDFEGTIHWSMKMEYTDPATKAQMEQAQKQMNDPATQARVKEMKEKMNDPQFKAMMDSNPQMKAQMENMIKMAEGGGMNSMMPTGMTVKIKNGNSHNAIEGGMMATETIYQKDKNQTIMLNSQSKTYTIFAADKSQATAEPQGEVKVTKTAETKKILNYTCTKSIVSVTHGANTVDQIFWTTTEIKNFDMKSLGKQRMNGGQPMYYEKLEGFPLQMEMMTPQAKMIMEVTAIKKESIPASVFEIPTGFTETKMPGQH